MGGVRPAAATPAHLSGGRITALADGALVIDADSGALLRTDASGALVSQVAIGRDAGLMTVDPVARRVYIADRRNDRIAVVRLDTLAIVASFPTPAEPYGVALSPDRSLLVVSTIADRTLVGYDAATGVERWRRPLGGEPRGVAVSPDGARALVASLTTGSVEQIALAGALAGTRVALEMPERRSCRSCGNSGDSFARAAFAVTFLGDRVAVVPFQRATPVQDLSEAERPGTYGGGSGPPIGHMLAFLGFGDGRVAQAVAQLSIHQPRALAWDGARDILYVAGLGSDSVLAVRDASQATVRTAGVLAVVPSVVDADPRSRAKAQGPTRCGPDGLATTPRGDVLVWCAFSRRVERLEVAEPARDAADDDRLQAKLIAGPPVGTSAMTAAQQRGMVVFHAADSSTSAGGSLACASCHPEGRADGLSWRIERRTLQTPLLSGRLVGTHPFKWDGTDPSLKASLRSTMQRLGGRGLTPDDTAALAAYLEALPPVRAPRRDVAQVARGQQLFDAEGCRACHDGPAYTDRARHALTGTLRRSDTPSLLGLAASAPYFHDGSAATLEALLRDRGAVHGMADTARMTDAQVRDLTAFLETL